jgi:hypothetical protein
VGFRRCARLCRTTDHNPKDAGNVRAITCGRRRVIGLPVAKSAADAAPT